MKSSLTPPTEVGSDAFTVSVAKAGSTTDAKVQPGKPKAGNKVTLKVSVAGDTVTKTLTDGKLKLNLGRFGKGTYKVKVVYLGSSTVEGSKTKVTFSVS
jgi:hypothetical protein